MFTLGTRTAFPSGVRATNLAGAEPPRRPRRAQRYALHLPVRYRLAGESRWHTGLTENISESGVSIRSHGATVSETRVTVVIALPSNDLMPGGCLIGDGTVVRAADAPMAGGSTFAVIAALKLARRDVSHRPS